MIGEERGTLQCLVGSRKFLSYRAFSSQIPKEANSVSGGYFWVWEKRKNGEKQAEDELRGERGVKTTKEGIRMEAWRIRLPCSA